MKVIQCELKNYSRRADNSVSLRLDSLIELSSKEVGEIDSYRGSVGFVVLTDTLVGNEVRVNIDDIIRNLPENDAMENYKSPSKRFRDILWRLLEQDLGRRPSKEEFADYYKREYDKISEHYKGKFDDEIV